MDRLWSAVLAIGVLAGGGLKAHAQSPGADTVSRTVPESSRVWNQAVPWDLQVVKTINLGLASAPMDFAMSGISHPLFTAGVPYLIVLKRTAASLETGGTIAAAELTGLGASEVLKRLFQRPRPYLEDAQIRTPNGLEPSDSFPSGHASLAFAWATILASDDPVLSIPAYALATGIGFSRVYLGLHHPTDVAAGAVLGIGSGLAVLSVRDALWKQGILPRFGTQGTM